MQYQATIEEKQKMEKYFAKRLYGDDYEPSSVTNQQTTTNISTVTIPSPNHKYDVHKMQRQRYVTAPTSTKDGDIVDLSEVLFLKEPQQEEDDDEFIETDTKLIKTMLEKRREGSVRAWQRKRSRLLGEEHDLEVASPGSNPFTKKRRPNHVILTALSGMTRRGYTMDDHSDIHIYMVKGNQYTGEEGGAACTSISFQSAFFMTKMESIRDVIDKIDWENKVIKLGIAMWNIWKKNYKSRFDSYQSIGDLTNIKGMDRLLEFMGPRHEFSGPLNKVNRKIYEQIVKSQVTDECNADVVRETIVVPLPRALKKMVDLAKQPGQNHTVALLFSSGATISLYAERTGQFAIYDSHGINMKNGYSAILRCADLRSAVDAIRNIMAHFTGNGNVSEQWGGEVWGNSKQYNICIFSCGEKK